MIKSSIVLLLRNNIGYNLHVDTHRIRIANADEKSNASVKIKVIATKWKIICIFASWK